MAGKSEAGGSVAGGSVAGGSVAGESVAGGTIGVRVRLGGVGGLKHCLSLDNASYSRSFISSAWTI